MANTDEQIKMAILNRLSGETWVDVSSVLVEVSNGRVILLGAVPTQRTKNNAYEQAKKISGVISVDNQLEVVGSENPEVLPGAEIENEADKILSRNPDIDASKIKVSADAGHVTIKGIVNSYRQLHKVKELLSNINGVILVKNELAVVSSENVSDEMLAKNIIEDFNRPDRLVASSILVEVDDGVVTLTGSVKNNKAVKQAFEFADMASGVRKIINNINIALR